MARGHAPLRRPAALARAFARAAAGLALLAVWQAAAPPAPPAVPDCADGIEVAARGEAPDAARIGCAAEGVAAGCPAAVAGDRVVLQPGGCTLVPQGMRATWMLAWGLPLDVNRRSAEELVLVPQLGADLAARIVAHRALHGPFPTLQALTAVRGVGAKRLRQLQPYLSVGTG